jgi:hypothetical protein
MQKLKRSKRIRKERLKDICTSKKVSKFSRKYGKKGYKLIYALGDDSFRLEIRAI